MIDVLLIVSAFTSIALWSVLCIVAGVRMERYRLRRAQMQRLASLKAYAARTKAEAMGTPADEVRARYPA